MDNYNEWVAVRVAELLSLKVKKDGIYDEEIIREYLIFAQHNKSGDLLIRFFEENSNDESLLRVLLNILLDESEDYSNDARYSAAKIISGFDRVMLKKYKDKLIYAQNYKLKNLRPFTADSDLSWLY